MNADEHGWGGRWVALMALALLFCGTSAGGASATQPSTRPALPSPVLPDGLGVNIHFTDPRPGEMKMLAAAGFTWVRMDFTWASTERRRGEYDFSAYERLLRACDEHGIRALFILDYANRLYDDGLPPHTDEGRAAMAKWAAAAAKKFRGRGVLWEMWNEPNIAQFWKPKPNVEDYAKLALAVGKAIRHAAPGETYIGPATSTIDFPFLEACFSAGLLEYWSAVSVHPYRQKDPETSIDDYRRLRALIDKHAPAGRKVPMLSGEWGYSSGWKNFSEERQARYLPRQSLTNISNGVPLSIWYDWHDDGPDPKEPEHHFGTVRHDYHEGRESVYDAKPAYLAATTLASQLAGYRFKERLEAKDPGNYVLLFEKGPDVKVAVWTTAKEPRQVSFAAGGGSFRVADHLGNALPDVSADEGTLTVTATDAPQYLTPTKPADPRG